MHQRTYITLTIIISIYKDNQLAGSQSVFNTNFSSSVCIQQRWSVFCSLDFNAFGRNNPKWNTRKSIIWFLTNQASSCWRQPTCKTSIFADYFEALASFSSAWLNGVLRQLLKGNPSPIAQCSSVLFSIHPVFTFAIVQAENVIASCEVSRCLAALFKTMIGLYCNHLVLLLYLKKPESKKQQQNPNPKAYWTIRETPCCKHEALN